MTEQQAKFAAMQKNDAMRFKTLGRYVVVEMIDGTFDVRFKAYDA